MKKPAASPAETREVAVRKDIQTLTANVKALVIDGPESQTRAEELLVTRVKPKEKEIEALFEEPPYSYRERKDAFDEVSKPRRSLLNALEALERLLRNKLNERYQALEDAAEVERAAARLALQKAEAKRIKKETGERVDPTDLIVPEPLVEAPAPTTPGISRMKNWTFTIPDFLAFVVAVAEGRIPLNWLLPNERLMRETSKAIEAPSGYPEVIFHDTGTFQVRS